MSLTSMWSFKTFMRAVYFLPSKTGQFMFPKGGFIWHLFIKRGDEIVFLSHPFFFLCTKQSNMLLVCFYDEWFRGISPNEDRSYQFATADIKGEVCRQNYHNKAKQRNRGFHESLSPYLLAWWQGRLHLDRTSLICNLKIACGMNFSW